MLLKPAATFLYAALLSLTFAQAQENGDSSISQERMRRVVRGSGQEGIAEPLMKRQSTSTANVGYFMGERVTCGSKKWYFACLTGGSYLRQCISKRPGALLTSLTKSRSTSLVSLRGNPACSESVSDR